MNKEMNYIDELKKALRRNDENKIEETINEFYYEFYESIDTEREDKYYDYLNKIMGLFYKKIMNEGELKYKIFIKFSLLNEDMLSYIVYPYWNRLKRKFDRATLDETSLNDQGETNESNLFTEMIYIAENIYYRHAINDSGKNIMNKNMIQFIEARMKDLTNLILLGRGDMSNKENKPQEDNNSDELFIKKFRGNALQKRKSGNIQKYTRVSKIIKVAEEHLPQLKLTQTVACEIEDCNYFSFTRWKNYANNFDLFLQWQQDIGIEELEEIKKEIISYFKLQSDM